MNRIDRMRHFQHTPFILFILSEMLNFLLLRRPAHEVRGVVGAAGSLVFGDLREGEKRVEYSLLIHPKKQKNKPKNC